MNGVSGLKVRGTREELTMFLRVPEDERDGAGVGVGVGVLVLVFPPCDCDECSPVIVGVRRCPDTRD